MSMRWYYYTPNCEYCGDGFEASRQDARFCSNKCRTANYRRDKRRQDAADGMATEWTKATNHAHGAILNELPDLASQIQDIYIEHSPAAAAAAVELAHRIFCDVVARTENRLQKKQDRIDRLEEDAKLLDQMAKLINTRPRRW